MKKAVAKATRRRAAQEHLARRLRNQPVMTITHVTPTVRAKKVYSSPQGRAYQAYINSQEWADKRNLYWRTYGYGCKAVGCTRKANLHVHHHTYERFGNERLSDLVGLCHSHHEDVHAFHKKNPRLTLTEATSRVTGIQL